MANRPGQRKQEFLKFEFEALKEIPGKLSWFGFVWLFFELIFIAVIVVSCYA